MLIIKKEFGLSIYPNKDNLADCLALIKEAGQAGMKRIFSCLISMEPENIQLFQTLIPEIHAQGLQLITDVSSSVFKRLHLDTLEDPLAFFADLRLDGVRLDYGFDEGEIAQFSHNKHGLIIEINASMPLDFDKLASYKPDYGKLQACHNFYPQVYTGLSEASLARYNRSLKENGLKVVSFISSKHPEACGPWPLKEGLSTLEKHRHIPFIEELFEVLEDDNIDQVLISNMPVLEEEMALIKELNEDCLTFTLELDEALPAEVLSLIQEHLNKPIWLRPERSEYLLRSAGRISASILVFDQDAGTAASFASKSLSSLGSLSPSISTLPISSLSPAASNSSQGEGKSCSDKDKKEPSQNEAKAEAKEEADKPALYQRGEVLLLNQDYGRYNGELQIVLKPMPWDSRKNRIGRIAEKDLEKLLLTPYVNHISFGSEN